MGFQIQRLWFYIVGWGRVQTSGQLECSMSGIWQLEVLQGGALDGTLAWLAGRSPEARIKASNSRTSLRDIRPKRSSVMNWTGKMPCLHCLRFYQEDLFLKPLQVPLQKNLLNHL